MNFELVLAGYDQKEALANVMQFYFYDFSEFVNIDIEENGCFKPYPVLDEYWVDENRYPYFVMVDGIIAGFVLVRYIESEKRNYYSMAEFFIMKKYRRGGLGKAVAHRIFDLYRGEWEVFEITPNKPAQAFWRKTIGEYTNGNYTERIEEKRVCQDFCNL